LDDVIGCQAARGLDECVAHAIDGADDLVAPGNDKAAASRIVVDDVHPIGAG
jgi:hypothetical protein